MKLLLFPLVFILFFGLISHGEAQGLMDKELDMSIPGTKWDVMGGLHIGAFDCNQTLKYPLSVGATLFGQYIPRVQYPFFLGAELGSFLVKGEEDPDKWGRKINLSFLDFMLYGGYEMKLNAEDKDIPSYALKIALGIPYVQPLGNNSEGPGLNKSSGGIGAGALVFLDLPNRLSLYGTIYRVGKDLDGFGYDDAGNVLPANKLQVTYLYKWGFVWNFIP